MTRGMGNLSCGKRLREWGLFSLEKRRLQNDPIAAFQYQKRDGERLFRKACSGSKRGMASKSVVDQIDTLTCDLQLEDEMTDSSKTDTLNSSSSSTTASSLEKVKVRGNVPLIKPPVHPSAILTVLRKPNPPPPPPRLTPVKCEEPPRLPPLATQSRLMAPCCEMGACPLGPGRIANGDMCCIPSSNLEKVVMQPLVHRPEKDQCPQPGARERVRFSEKVQYHGYCPDCDVRYNIKKQGGALAQ
ncbi:hypothetical protein DUI87_26414 [Hirundo rustica rustica]|uniref:Uncharacterized protein n=1 Tax=Hirundo rustica rustica TaxID=333673 RepID=A0A3M0JA55_HIRRU|nr:hypothetical protein DUI87_26414 [Hirundo rustica rustica]